MGLMTRPEPAHGSRDPARDGVFRGIQLLLFLDVVLGVTLAVVGSAVLEADSIAYAGVGLAIIGLALMIFFRALAQREAARQAAAHGPAARSERLRGTGKGRDG